MAKFKDLKELSRDELLAKLSEIKKEIMKENAQIAIGTSPKNTGKFRESKKAVAKIMMLLNSKDATKANNSKASKQKEKQESPVEEKKKDD